MEYENGAVMDRIFEKIKEYDSIILFRHLRLDGDCVGATKGFERMLRLTWPEKKVRISDGQRSAYFAFAGMERETVPETEMEDALGIVLDTAVRDRVSDARFLRCREVIKIDHHIQTDPYGDLNWVEEERSSVCEMAAVFYRRFSSELCLDGEAAGYLYLGMVTDSGRFRFSGTDGDTLRLAGMLVDRGVDLERLYANLYLKDFGEWKYRAWVYENMTMSPGGVVTIRVDMKTRERFGLDAEAAAAAISMLENIRGALMWLAFIEIGNEKNEIRVRLRSRFIRCDGLAAAWRGGGHAFASGATAYGWEEAEELAAGADRMVAEYKKTHEGWM